MKRTVSIFAVFAATFLLSTEALSYGWLSHWRVVEAQWPPLSKNVCASVGLPNISVGKHVSDAEVAYMAGLGAIFSDIGYMPGGPQGFSDLVHYIGTGEFTDNLVREICMDKDDSRDARMLAFAAGFRSHYFADRYGHYGGTNAAAAKISAKGKDGQERVVYEEDIPTHKQIELGAFSAADLKYGVVQVASQFITLSGTELLVNRIARAVHNALLATYGNPALVFEPTVAHILNYSLHATRHVCSTAKMMLNEKLDEPTDKGLQPVVNVCDRKLKARNIPSEDKDTISLISKGLAFFKSRKEVYKFYKDSTVEVERWLARSGQFPMTNINLDTGLPSASGQYRKADAIYSAVAKVRTSKCDLPAFTKTAKGDPVGWRTYQDVGQCVSEATRPQHVTLPCATVLQSTELSLVQQGWLGNIVPGGHVGAVRNDIQVAGMRFTAGTSGSLTADRASNQLQFLYACHAQRLPAAIQADIDHGAVEAIDRLRLRSGDKIDSSTSLYK